MAYYVPLGAPNAENAEQNYEANKLNVSKGGRPTLLGWLIFLLVLFLLNKTRTGHTLIYWGLVVVAIYLFVANYKRIVPLLQHQ